MVEFHSFYKVYFKKEIVNTPLFLHIIQAVITSISTARYLSYRSFYVGTVMDALDRCARALSMLASIFWLLATLIVI